MGKEADRLFVVLNKDGGIAARGPAECAPDAAMLKRGGYRLKFLEGEKGRKELEAMLAKQREAIEARHRAERGKM